MFLRPKETFWWKLEGSSSSRSEDTASNQPAGGPVLVAHNSHPFHMNFCWRFCGEFPNILRKLSCKYEQIPIFFPEFMAPDVKAAYYVLICPRRQAAAGAAGDRAGSHHSLSEYVCVPTYWCPAHNNNWRFSCDLCSFRLQICNRAENSYI